MPTDTEGREAVVPEAAARRIANQVARAYRGTYGARTGLRTLVNSVSVQMLRGGSSADAVVRAIVDLVRTCPIPAIDGSPTAISDPLSADALAELTAEYASSAAMETRRTTTSGDDMHRRRALSRLPS